LTTELVITPPPPTPTTTPTTTTDTTTTTTTTTTAKRSPKNVMCGFHSRDEMDISAQILEVAARQDLMTANQVRRNAFRRGDHKRFRINKDGVVSVHQIRRLIHISQRILDPYIARLIRHGLMEIQNLTIKRHSIKHIPVITDKGRYFLQVYREIKNMLSALFG